MNDDIRKNALILWNYLVIKDHLEQADIIFVCGGHDSRVADEATKLFNKGMAGFVVVSGGIKREVYGLSKMALEADILAEHIYNNGVPKECIIKERESKNTGENLEFTERMLHNLGIKHDSAILVQKPYAAKRTLCLAKKKWANKEIYMHTEDVSFDQYLDLGIPDEKIISMMVGEVQRLIYSPQFGWIDEVYVPENVVNAYSYLCEKGYTSRLMSEDVIKKCIEGIQDNISIGAN